MSSSTSTSRTTKLIKEEEGAPNVKRKDPQVTHRGEGSSSVLPPTQKALEPPVPMSPVPKPSDDAAETGVKTAFEEVNARSDLKADEKLDILSQQNQEQDAFKAEQAARDRIHGNQRSLTKRDHITICSESQ